MNSSRLVRLFVMAYVTSMAFLSYGGDSDYLNPTFPPGDLRAKMKSLNEIEPREAISALPFPITNSGAYYLTRSLPGSNGVDGIMINADDVKLDLNGFALNGVTGSGNGISVIGPARHNITIRNGVVRGWGVFGITAGNAHESLLENITAFSNTLDGIVIGENSVVRNCGGFKNLGNGLAVGRDGSIIDCKMRDNGQNGIVAGMSCRLDGCTASRNVQAGISVANYSTVRDCITVENFLGPGILVSSKCRIVGNTSGSNTNSAGIKVMGCNNKIEDNSVANNQWGIFVDDTGFGNLVVRNSATGNFQQQDYRMSPPTSGGDYFGEFVSTNRMTNGNFGFLSSNPWSNFRF